MSIEIYRWLLRRVKDAEKFDLNAEREQIKAESPDDSPYPSLCGILEYHRKELVEAAKRIYEDLVKVERRKSALEWAAEHCLNDEDISTNDGGEVYTLLYAVADVIEHALENGMTDDVLRSRLGRAIEDDEIAKGRFILPEERCKGDGETDCDTFVGDDAERCDTCQEIYEENLPNPVA